jgi:S-adenosylmethionine hydrolase
MEAQISMMPALITLLTDFGTADGYVGEMKGVILTRAPDARLVDVSHEIAPHDIDAGRLTLARYWRRFPAGTIHVAVVDPGVGSLRAALAVSSDGRFLVGPDNGLLSPALLVAGARAVALPIPAAAAPTFHGRDVFAPAAAMLASGATLDALGPMVDAPVLRRTPEPHRREDGAIAGEVILVDRFGNAVTNLVGRRGGALEVNGRQLRLVQTYADAEPGELVALCGSTGLIEVALREGSAASQFGIRRGTSVLLRPPGH